MGIFCPRVGGIMFARIKYFIQRGKRGYSDRDLWGLGYYISWLMTNALTDFEKNMNSYPAKLDDGEWVDIIKDIRAGFKAILDMEELVWVKTEDFNKEYKKLEKIKNKGLRLFAKHVESLWD